MQPRAYYSEIDKSAAAWLRELIRENLIAPGDVDDRSIVDVRPADLVGYTQCHFFAGIGGWSLALRLADWPDDRAIWTGSCPCQPFSSAGKGDGFADERHLWPSWYWLIGECGPGVIVGEQVESPAARAWFDLVSTDLEALAYTSAAVDLPAASVGSPNIRQRLVWLADRSDADGGSGERGAQAGTRQNGERRRGPSSGGDSRRMADVNDRASDGGDTRGEGSARRLQHRPDAGGRVGADRVADELRGGFRVDGATSGPGAGRHADERWPIERMADGGSIGRQARCAPDAGCESGPALTEHGGRADGLGNAGSERRQQVGGSASADEAADGRAGRVALEPNGNHVPSSAIKTDRLVDRLVSRLEGLARDGVGGIESRRLDADAARSIAATGATGGAWADADWLYCTDEKFRPAEPGTFPLAYGVPARVGRLRGYGNAINPYVAAEVMRAYMAERGIA
jgi:DNA (cytosine-5)-methyltransferase 1